MIFENEWILMAIGTSDPRGKRYVGQNHTPFYITISCGNMVVNIFAVLSSQTSQIPGLSGLDSAKVLCLLKAQVRYRRTDGQTDRDTETDRQKRNLSSGVVTR